MGLRSPAKYGSVSRPLAPGGTFDTSSINSSKGRSPTSRRTHSVSAPAVARPAVGGRAGGRRPVPRRRGVAPVLAGEAGDREGARHVPAGGLPPDLRLVALEPKQLRADGLAAQGRAATLQDPLCPVAMVELL